MPGAILRQFKKYVSILSPELAAYLSRLRPRTRRRYARLADGSREERFSRIYRERLWAGGGAETASGSGSTLEATSGVREQLPALLRELDIKALLDAPCGDFNWMRTVALPETLSYIGGDIVPDLAAQLQAEYGGPTRRFIRLDLAEDRLPEADLLLCRDLLLHLSNEDILRVLANVAGSSLSYVVCSTYPAAPRNIPIETGMARPVNLQLPPFNLPPPIQALPDPAEGHPDKVLGVWRREDFRPGGRNG